MTEDSLFRPSEVKDALTIEIEAKLEQFLKLNTSDEALNRNLKELPPSIIRKNAEQVQKMSKKFDLDMEQRQGDFDNVFMVQVEKLSSPSESLET